MGSCSKSSVGVSLSKPTPSTEAKFGFSKANAYRELNHTNQTHIIHQGTKNTKQQILAAGFPHCT